MDNTPYTDERSREKTVRLVKRLEKISGKKIRMYIVPHGHSLEQFSKNCRKNLECVLCKRMMLRAGNAIAKLEGAEAVVTGESLGQVASQTLANLRAEEDASELPVLRPLIGLDKTEIIEIAKAIGTFELSISPCASCGIVPEKPATRAGLGYVLEEEEKTDIGKLLESAMSGRTEAKD
jgi:thiamine biosynthesis protein ThiI